MVQNFVRNEKGVAAVEFALVAPILLLLLLGLADFGLAMRERMALASAARAGAERAWADSGDNAAITQAVQAAGTLDAAAITVAVTEFCECAGTASACGVTCADGSTPATYVGVSVSEDFPLLLPYPGIGSPIALTGTAILRVQ